MTTALRVPHPSATDAKRVFLASAARDSVHLHYSGVTDQTKQAAHSEAVRFSRAADVGHVARCIMATTDGGFET